MKTDKTKNWTDSWKEQLDEYSVTPPPEVWEELSKELAPPSEKNHLVGSRLYYTFVMYFYRVTIPPSDYRLK